MAPRARSLASLVKARGLRDDPLGLGGVTEDEAAELVAEALDLVGASSSSRSIFHVKVVCYRDFAPTIKVMPEASQRESRGQEMNGLWTAEFGSTADMFGTGVAVFRDGTILGGDATHFYIGEYKVSGDAFNAKLKVSPFVEGAESVFKTKGQDLTLNLEGTIKTERQAIALGRPEGIPNLSFAVKLTKRW